MEKYHKGYMITHNGYKLLMSKNHPNKNKQGYVREHILVMEKSIGRFLTEKEVVHHKDENKLNNDIDNLELMSDYDHRSIHSSKPRKLVNLKLASELLLKGYTMPQVASKLNLCESGLRKKLKKEGIQLGLKRGGARKKIFDDFI